ncbi:MAG: 50S ribosomal protein L30 [Candidatus Coatesbacteria bacterium]|nr:50S ribosomal protein L30 [Candidatus Coatesbacteria bacterium]
MNKVAITQIKSQIGALKQHKVTLKTLGLGKIGRTVVHDDTPQIRGMAYAVRHLVEVETLED